MKKTKISFYFVFISFFTFLTILFSIIQKSYFNFVTPKKLVDNDTLLTNFDPNLDLTIISTIEAKNKNIDEAFDFSIIKSNQKQAEVTLTPTITSSPQTIEANIIETTLTPTMTPASTETTP